MKPRGMICVNTNQLLNTIRDLKGPMQDQNDDDGADGAEAVVAVDFGE